QQDQPGGYTHSDPGADLEGTPPIESGGPCGHEAGPEDLPIAGRGSGQHQRRPEARGTYSGEPNRAELLWPEFGGSQECDRRRQRESGEGQLRWTTSVVPDRC